MTVVVPPRPQQARQLLPKQCYLSEQWFEREQRELFARAWSFACVAGDVPEPGDYAAVQIGRFPMFVIRGRDGELRAYHNTCRHRGTAMLEGRGNARRGVVCPYHTWTYDPDDGALRGLPKRSLCFPDIDTAGLGLHRAGIGQLGDLVFVNPQPQPEESFQAWLAGVEQVHMWSHRLSALSEKRPVRYDINANWKVFCENAMDGYHLSYLHHRTLKGPDVELQGWDDVGRHWVFIRESGEAADRSERHYTPIPGVADSGRRPVVWQFFPNSGVLATPIFFSAYTIVPVAPERCALELRTWMMPREEGTPTAPPRERPSGTSGHGHIDRDGRRVISLDTLSLPAMESLDFQIEDMWVCEQQQKAMHSPHFAVGPMAAPGETALTFFQANVLAFVPLEAEGATPAAADTPRQTA